MVSEPPRRSSYAAALMAEGNSGDETTPPSPIAPPNLQEIGGDEYSNPFYLHVSENPNAVLVSPSLNEHNYNSWSRSMRMALEIKNKLGFIDGTLLCPDEGDPFLASWKRCNTMICAWIVKSVSPIIAESIMYYGRSADMWKDLKDRFSQRDPHRISQLQNLINNNKQGNLSITDYYSRCKGLWEQLTEMRPLPMCECTPRCSCSIISKIRQEREEDRVIRFLEGLNDAFDSVKSGVLVMEHVPSVDKVFKMALKLEKKLAGSDGGFLQGHVSQAAHVEANNEECMAAASTGSGSQSNAVNGKKYYTRKSIPKCTFCGRTGHTIDKCYKKHGFPPGWIPGYKTREKQAQSMQQNTAGSVNQISELGISNDQFQKLLSLLQNQAGQSSSTAANVTINTPSLTPNFKPNTEKGLPWDEGWFC